MRYQVISAGDDKYVWDQKASVLYMFNRETKLYDLTRATSLHSWLKFMPYAENEGTTDTFPGKLSGDRL